MKKIISILMAFIIVLSSFIALPGGALEVLANTNTVTVQSKSMDMYGFFIYGSSETVPLRTKIDYYIDSDGSEQAAYCIDPLLNGVSELGAYEVDASTEITDPVIWGIIANGYPNKSVAELGVNSEAEAYYMTKMALYMYIRYNQNMASWRPVDSSFQGLLDKTIALYELGKTYTEINSSSYTVAPETTKAIEEGEYLTQVFSVTANTGNGNYSVTLDGNQPNGTKITDINGSSKTTFNLGEKFKVAIPKTSISTGGNFNFSIQGTLATNVVLYGEALVSGRQNYALNSVSANGQAKGTVTYDSVDVEIPNPSAGNGEIQIIKIEAGTAKPLAGAEFTVTDATGGVIGVYYSDGTGQVTIKTEKLGAYYIDETVPPFGYQLDESNHKDVVLTDDKPAIVTFSNKKSASLEITKVDADTNQPLKGAVIRVALDGGHEFFDIETDSNGKARLDNLKSGTFTVTEISAPTGFLLDSTPYSIKLESGQSHTITLTNSRKPSLIIRKYDEDTGLPLPGAEFSIAKKGGSIVHEGIVDEYGVMQIEGLDEGWYSITELAPPSGYLISTEIKDIYLEGGKIVEVKFDNRLRPSLQIIKIDEATGEPLAGAVFKVWKTEDSTVSEYVTDESGTITIFDLDEDIYSVLEYAAPDNYLPEEQHKDIQLEWGKMKTLVFTNKKRPVLEIQKIDSVTGEPLAGAVFLVTKTEDKSVSEYVTDSSGKIIIEGLDESVYTVVEKSAPTNYILDPQQKEIALEWGTTKTLIYENTLKPTLVITKTNALTMQPIPNTYYKIQWEDSDGGVKTLGTYKTDSDGKIILPFVDTGWYIITETRAAEGMQLPSNPVNRIYLSAGDNSYSDIVNDGNTSENTDNDNNNSVSGSIIIESGYDYMIGEEIINYPLNSIVVKKTSSATGELLSGATFDLLKVSGEISGTGGTVVATFTTDTSGTVVITGLEAGGYILKETKAPDNYLLNENNQQQVWLKSDGTTIAEVTFTNIPYGNLLITKVDTDTGEPLKGARFKVVDSSGAVIGTSNGEFETDVNGEVLITGIKPQTLVVTEILAPDGYIIEDAPKTIDIGTDGKTYSLSFTNSKKSGLQIIKIDADTKEPLKDAQFIIYHMSGEVLGTYTTNGNGVIILDNLEPNYYKIVESKAPNGYKIDDTPQDIHVTSNQFLKITFENKKLASLIIKKIDEDTGEPLNGALFRIEKQNGEFVTEAETDAEGLITIPELAPDYYVVRETRAKSGYLLDESPKIVEVKTTTPTVVTFTNKALTGLQITKLNSITREPLEGVEFTLSRISGERIGNYKTNTAGQIFVSGLEPNYYVVQEVKTLDNFYLDSEPLTVEIKSGENTVLEVLNTPKSSLLIVKTDMQTKKPLYGVAFEVTKTNGEIVFTGKTDKNGHLYVNELTQGTYYVSEKKALDGYELDTAVYEVIIREGKQTKLEVQNKPLSGLRLQKIDSITKEPIYNVEFMVFDHNNKVVGTFYTDNKGIIDFSAILAEGRYTIRETRQAENYYPDNVPRTVEFISGKVTTIVWENTPMAGQIQVNKTSQDQNSVNSLPAGTPLEGAVFEVYDYKSGNLIDKFITGYDGKGISQPLPLGRYRLKEVQSPTYYKINDTEIDVTIEFATQIIKIDVTNESANIGVSINKTAPKEVVAGQEIRYDIKNIRNTSTVPLNDFYWRDTLPTDAMRIKQIVTGTYSQSLNYKVIVATNKGNTKVIADNLSTTQNHVIECSGVALGLGNDEYIISFQLMFGTVKAGFTVVDEPRVYGVVNNGLPNTYRFVNKVDVGGQHNGEWIITNATAGTEIYSYQNTTLPKTGY